MYSEVLFLHVMTRDKPQRAADLSHRLNLRFRSSKVGFPIRKSADQSSFAAPRGISQRTTSFIASQRQGIHQMPLRHLIALIVDAHPSAEGFVIACGCSRAIEPEIDVVSFRERPACFANHPKDVSVVPTLARRSNNLDTAQKLPEAATFGWFALFTMSNSGTSRSRILPRRGIEVSNRTRLLNWWSQTESNRRPPACKAGALPTELWPRIRAPVIGDTGRSRITGGPGKI